MVQLVSMCFIFENVVIAFGGTIGEGVGAIC